MNHVLKSILNFNDSLRKRRGITQPSPVKKRFTHLTLFVGVDTTSSLVRRKDDSHLPERTLLGTKDDHEHEDRVLPHEASSSDRSLPFLSSEIKVGISLVREKFVGVRGHPDYKSPPVLSCSSYRDTRVWT